MFSINPEEFIAVNLKNEYINTYIYIETKRKLYTTVWRGGIVIYDFNF